MMNSTFRSVLRVAAFVTTCAFPAAVTAQGSPQPAGVFSIDPLAIANQILTAEAEFCGGELSGAPMGCAMTVGLATAIQRHPRPDGSRSSQYHVDTEGLLRVRGAGLSGLWYGVRTGLTFADRYGLRPSIGADAGMSWHLARRLYTSVSVGAKKVILLDDNADLCYNPSFRVAAGYTF